MSVCLWGGGVKRGMQRVVKFVCGGEEKRGGKRRQRVDGRVRQGLSG